MVQLEVVVDDERRPVPGDKLQALLSRLLLERNRPVATDRLIDDLWGARPPATARQSLHAHIARLRRLLAAGEDGSMLGTDGRGYILRVDDDQLDAERFQSLVATAREERRSGRTAAAGQRLREALDLWRGPVLDGVPLEGAEGERAELEGLRLAALEERIDVDLSLGAAAEVLPELEQLVRSNPLRERAWGQLMVALYASGRQADALATYQNARRELAAVGLEPEPRLRELEQAILNQDSSLGTPPPHHGAERPQTFARRAVAALLAIAAITIVVVAIVAAQNEPPRAAVPAVPPVHPNSLVEIDPGTNRVVSSTRVGRGPESIASSKDAIWVANVEDRTVSQLPWERRKCGSSAAHRSLATSLAG